MVNERGMKHKKSYGWLIYFDSQMMLIEQMRNGSSPPLLSYQIRTPNKGC